MTAVYDKLGVKFLYPENWKLTEDSGIESSQTETEASTAPTILTLETPDGSSTWAVHIHGSTADEDLMLKEVLASLQETYEDLEISPYNQAYGDVEAKGVEAMFYCLDFLIRAHIHTIKVGDHALLFWSQAEDREFDKQHIVFQAISIGLLQSLS